MQIYGSTQVHGAQAINAPHTKSLSTSAPARTSGASDQLDISAAADLASRLADVPDIRQDKVNAIRAALANGTYETQDRLNGAISQLLDEIG